MKAIEFIKNYEAYLSLRGIEKGLDIPVGTLRRSILEGRIPYKHEKKIVDKFTFLTRDPLSAGVTPPVAEKATPRVARKVIDKKAPVSARVTERVLQDLKEDGSLDKLKLIDGTWDLTYSGKYIKNGVKVDPIEKGGKIYYKVD